MTTYGVAAPLSSRRHWRKATCREVQCRHWREGWASVFDETTELGRGQANYVRNFSGRRFRESRADDGRTLFEFSPEQPCFSTDSHVIRDEDVPPLYIARGGDWRADPDARVIRHSGPDPWLDQLHSNLERVVTRLEDRE
jgi:hypothetical protein